MRFKELAVTSPSAGLGAFDFAVGMNRDAPPRRLEG